jgi:hypothetical protein
MSRILVDPDQLQSLAAQFAEMAAGLQALGRRSVQGLAEADWASQALAPVMALGHEAGQRAAGLAGEADELGQGLRQTAERFRAANAWRPARTGQGGTGIAGAATAAGVGVTAHAGRAATMGRAAGAGATTATATQGATSTTPGSGPTAPNAPTDPLAPLYARFADPQVRKALEHVVRAEGMNAPNAAHGAVVYRGKNGWLCDQRWLNFGYISFAMPEGGGDSVLRRIFATPGEAEAFKEIALRHLQDRSASPIPASHIHLLRAAGPEVPALSAAEQADQFIALARAGKPEALADWFLKYGNEPVVERQVATGHLRPDWEAVMDEFLARPASVQAQLETLDQDYLQPAKDSAANFGFRSEKAVAWFLDQHVQSGSPTDEMRRMLDPQAPAQSDQLYSAWQRFHTGDERERLQVLTELSGSPGTDVRERREAVLADRNLTWTAFTAKEA